MVLAVLRLVDNVTHGAVSSKTGTFRRDFSFITSDLRPDIEYSTTRIDNLFFSRNLAEYCSTAFGELNATKRDLNLFEH